jgi:hypothetical protein
MTTNRAPTLQSSHHNLGGFFNDIRATIVENHSIILQTSWQQEFSRTLRPVLQLKPRKPARKTYRPAGGHCRKVAYSRRNARWAEGQQSLLEKGTHCRPEER